MFDKYMICEETVRNVRRGNETVGFEFGARLPYYRGLGLSMIEDVAVTIDGEKIARGDVRMIERATPAYPNSPITPATSTPSGNENCS